MLFEDEKIISYSKDIWNKVAVHEDRKEQDKEKPDGVVFPIKQRSTYPIQKPTYIVPANLLIEPCSVVIKNHFPITCGFAITVDKVQGQTLDRVIVTLSERDYRLMNFTYSCFYVGMSRVKKRKHLRILLKDSPNEVLQWHILAYLVSLCKEKSVDAFFAGFNNDRTNWISDKWNEETALNFFQKNN